MATRKPTTIKTAALLEAAEIRDCESLADYALRFAGQMKAGAETLERKVTRYRVSKLRRAEYQRRQS